MGYCEADIKMGTLMKSIWPLSLTSTHKSVRSGGGVEIDSFSKSPPTFHYKLKSVYICL